MVSLMCVCVYYCWIMLNFVVMWPAKGIFERLIWSSVKEKISYTLSVLKESALTLGI